MTHLDLQLFFFGLHNSSDVDFNIETGVEVILPRKSSLKDNTPSARTEESISQALETKYWYLAESILNSNGIRCPEEQACPSLCTTPGNYDYFIN